MKNNKAVWVRFISSSVICFALALSVSAFPQAVKVLDGIESVPAFDDAAVLASGSEGKCGNNLTWSFEDGTLIISGEGDMDNFESSGEERAPWYAVEEHIEHVVICDGVTRIGSMAFLGLGRIETVTFGKDIKTIGSSAFGGCVSIAELIFNEGLETIEYDAFKSCTGVMKIVFPTTVKEVEDGVFYNVHCDELYISDLEAWFGVLFNDKLSNPLFHAKNLYVDDILTAKLEIPQSIKSIGDYSLVSKFAVKELVVPSTLKSVYTDDMCIDSLENLYIEDIASYLNVKFEGFDWFTRYADNIYVDGQLLENLVIPEGVEKIYSGSFNGYEKIKTVFVSSTVKDIKVGAFLTSPVEKYVVDENNPYYSSDEHGVLFNKDKTELIQYPLHNIAKEYNIPDTVKIICDSAFSDAQYLKDVYIPDSVEEIQDYAFYSTLIEDIKIPGSVKYIYDGAFEDCFNLEYVSLAEGIEEIHNEAFKNCEKITSVLLPDSVKQLMNGAFYGCTSLEQVKLPKSIKLIESELFYECTSLKSVSIPKNVELIDNHAFYDCNSLESVRFESDVEVIGNHAFSGCGFESISLPDTVTEIGRSAFLACSNLKYIYIPENVEYIADMAFRGCVNLETVIISSQAELLYAVFNSCRNLKSVCITGDVSSISKQAFDINPAAFTIYSIEGSYVNTFADENNIPFESYLAAGECKNNLSWVIDSDGVLGIFGQGKMFSLDYGFEPCDYPWYEYRNIITAIEIHEGVTCVSKNAFGEGYSGVKKVTLPTTLLHLVEDAFLGCRGIDEVHIKDLDAWISVDFDSKAYKSNYCYSSSPLNYQADLYVDGEKLTYFELTDKYSEDFTIALSGCSSLKEVVIGDGIKKIPEGSFSFCTNLEKVTLSDSVVHIEPYAFECCSKLKSINLDTEKLWKIGEYAFAGSGLEYVKLPEQIKTISASTFNGCKNLEKIVIPKATVEIAEDAFDDCQNVVIYGYSGSYAETFANANNIPFVALTSCDLNSDNVVDMNDAVLLLQYSMFPELYSVDSYGGSLDYNDDGEVDMNDAILLLQHSMFPDEYPIG